MYRIERSRLGEIFKKPTLVNDIHQSVFRSHDILMYILDMVDRGDSKETIQDIYWLLSETEQAKTTN